MNDSYKIAVLFDAENISYKFVPEILDKAQNIGEIQMIRAYGDFSKQILSSWTQTAIMNGIRLVHQTNYRKGKSLADMALIVDAMDLFYGGRLDGFCIASSDGDFSPLCMALREKGAAIFGFGLQSTPDAFRATCNKFFLLDMKQSSSKAASKEVSAVSPLSDKLSQLVGLIDAGIAENGGFSLVSQLGSYLHKHVPNFRPKDFGGANLSKLLRMMPGRYVIEGSGEKMRARLIKENLHKQYSISHNIIKIAILIFIISVLFILICKAFLIH